MALLPTQILDLTQGELSDLFEGYLWRQERELQRLAWAVAHLLNASGSYRERITVNTLLGYELKTLLRVDEVPLDDKAFLAEKKAELAELKERFADIIPITELPKAENIKVEA